MNRREARSLAKCGQGVNVLRSGVEEIDPPTAAAWLETSRGNRRISQEHVNRLADDMRAGKYLTTHQGIAFDCDGHLIDGHHTLWAILLSGVTVQVMVTRNLRREAIRVIDTGKTRNLQDRLTMDFTWGQVSRAEAACLRRMIRGRSRTMRRSSAQEYQDWRDNHEHVRFALMITDGLGRGLRLAAIRAVIARAHKAVPAEQLQKFCWTIKRDDTLLSSIRGAGDLDTYDSIEKALWSFTHGGAPPKAGEGF